LILSQHVAYKYCTNKGTGSQNPIYMKFILTLSLLCLSLCSLHAQSFTDYIRIGDSLYQAEEYHESAQAYEKAFLLEEGNAMQHYNAACSWALSGDTIQSIHNLNLAAENGWKNVEHLQRDTDLKSIHSVRAWDNVLTKVKANLDEYEKDFNKPLKEQLEHIYVKDQMLRQLYAEAENKFGSESEEMSYFWQLVSEQDRKNEEEVIKIIENHGWVGKSTVGGKANMTLWLVIQHAPLETQEKYLPVMKESVLNGESNGRHLAMLEDRILMRNDKPQTYGSQIVTDEETGRQKVYEVKDPEYINQRRKQVGLGPIQDYVKRWGIQWTIEQKEK